MQGIGRSLALARSAPAKVASGFGVAALMWAAVVRLGSKRIRRW